MSKIVLNLAMSLDGYISDKDGGFQWIVGHGDNNQDTENQFSFDEFLQTVNVVVMGSKSYEDCILSGLTDFKDKRILVATSRKLEGRDNVEFINGDIIRVVENIKRQNDKDIFLFGGGGVVAPFIKADVIDQYIIGIIPTILGKGRTLFKEGNPEIKLHLDEISVSDGVSVMIYSKRRN